MCRPSSRVVCSSSMLEKVSNLVGGVVDHCLLTGRLLRKLFRQFQNAFGAEGESRSWTFKLPSNRGSETNVRTARRLSQLFPGSLGQSGCRLVFNAQPLDPRFRRLAAQEIVSTAQVRFATAQVAVSPPKNPSRRPFLPSRRHRKWSRQRRLPSRRRR